MRSEESVDEGGFAQAGLACKSQHELSQRPLIPTNNHYVELETAFEKLVLDLAGDGCGQMWQWWSDVQSKPTYPPGAMSSGGSDDTTEAMVVDGW